MKKGCLVFCIFLIVAGCNKENALEKSISEISVPFSWIRFDSLYATASPEQLPKLKTDFPVLFPRQFTDSVWLGKLNDPLFQEVFTEVEKNKKQLLARKQGVYHLFQHIKYYFPKQVIPKVITVISEVDYDNKIIWADSLLLVSADTYLGNQHHFYGGIPNYIRQHLDADYLLPDIALAFAQQQVPKPAGRTFLDEMVYHGKIRYLMELLLADEAPHLWLHYTEEQLKWAQENEAYIWMYIIEKELLYSTDPELNNRFINPAPFSKFYLEIDNESPGRIGQFIGWQIVRAYMQNNPVPLHEMLLKDAKSLFEESKFKPDK